MGSAANSDDDFQPSPDRRPPAKQRKYGRRECSVNRIAVDITILIIIVIVALCSLC